MKNKLSFLGIIAIVAMIVFSMTACEIDDGDSGTRTLSEDVWRSGNITEAGQTHEYSISVTSGTYYFIWWNDSYNGNGTKTVDILVSARYSDGTTLFNNVDSAWTTPQLIVSDRNGTLILNVRGIYSSTSVGSYEIRYTTRSGDIVPLSEGIWESDRLIATGQVNHYSINVENGTTCYIWWDDSYNGNGTKTVDILVSARYSDGTTLFTDVDSAWTTPQLVVSDRNGTLILNVRGIFSSSSVGSYAIAYRTTNSRP